MKTTDSAAARYLRANVKRHLDANGITVTDLAKRAGISRGHLSRFLSGGNNCTLGAAESIAAALESTLGAMIAEPANSAE